MQKAYNLCQNYEYIYNVYYNKSYLKIGLMNMYFKAKTGKQIVSLLLTIIKRWYE